MKPSDYRLVSCGILKDEIEQVLRERHWHMESVFLDSSLHVDLDKLAHGLGKILGNGERENLVCYGTCHPQMDGLMENSGSRRTAVQNCVELILGSESFNKHLADGAFFLFEDWALNWNRVTEPLFGTNPDNFKEVFRSEHSYLLGIRTPCSGNFTLAAEAISEQIGLPLKWHLADLRYLEDVLVRTIAQSE